MGEKSWEPADGCTEIPTLIQEFEESRAKVPAKKVRRMREAASTRKVAGENDKRFVWKGTQRREDDTAVATTNTTATRTAQIVVAMTVTERDNAQNDTNMAK